RETLCAGDRAAAGQHTHSSSRIHFHRRYGAVAAARRKGVATWAAPRHADARRPVPELPTRPGARVVAGWIGLVLGEGPLSGTPPPHDSDWQARSATGVGWILLPRPGTDESACQSRPDVAHPGYSGR